MSSIEPITSSKPSYDKTSHQKMFEEFLASEKKKKNSKIITQEKHDKLLKYMIDKRDTINKVDAALNKPEYQIVKRQGLQLISLHETVF
jgi:hypothetical protein